MSHKLAIVIPAYKADFLEETLESISQQTNKNFTLYIGDDNSPFNLYDIIKNFEDTIDIVYFKFQENLGGHDLVAQWNRCIDLVQEEEWIWFFSDDDVMEENCVEVFFSTLSNSPSSKLYHFDVKVIDKAGDIIKVPLAFPDSISTSTYHLLRWRSKLLSYVVEFVFSKKYFVENGGFPNFNYAWHTDEALWTKLSLYNGITTINGAFVLWRKSDVNITPNYTDLNVVSAKLEASISFSEWVLSFYKENSLKFTFFHRFYLVKRFVNQLAISNRALPANSWKAYLKRELSELEMLYMYPGLYIYYYYKRAKFL